MSSIASGVALIAASASLCLAQAASAQTAMMGDKAPTPAGQVAKPDPLDPGAKVPPLRYRSAFDGYRPNAEVEVGRWKDANDTVHRIGGWRAYAREASQGDGAASAPASPASAAAAKPAGHAHH